MDAFGFKASVQSGRYELFRLATDLPIVLRFVEALVAAAPLSPSTVVESRFKQQCKTLQPDPWHCGQMNMLDVTSPDNESGPFFPGSILRIKWTSHPSLRLTPMRIRLMQGDFDREMVNVESRRIPRYLKFVRFISISTSNTGYYKWKIPVDVPPGEHYKVQVDVKDQEYSDQSYAFDILSGRAPIDDDHNQEEEEDSDDDGDDEGFAVFADFGNDHYYGAYLKQKLSKFENAKINGKPIQVVLRDGYYPPNFGKQHPMVGMRGVFTGWTRFAPGVCVLWHTSNSPLHYGMSQTFEYWVNWWDIEIIDAMEVDHGHRRALVSGRQGNLHTGGRFNTRTSAKVEDRAFCCSIHPDGHDVFLSYRRSDGDGYAVAIVQAFEKIGVSVFYDRTCLGAQRFDQQLLHFVRTSSVFLPYLTENYLDPERFQNEDDWCKLEFLQAISSDRVILPVFLDSYKLHSSNGLTKLRVPEVVEAIRTNQCVSISMEFFEASIDRIGRMIRPFRIDPKTNPTSEIESGPPERISKRNAEKKRLPKVHAVEVTRPAPNQVVCIGERLEIEWHSTDKFNVNIKLYEKWDERRLQFLTVVVNNIKSFEGRNTYFWTVPANAKKGGDIKVVVEHSGDNSIRDQSYFFAILPAEAGSPHKSTSILSDSSARGATAMNESIATNDSPLKGKLPSANTGEVPLQDDTIVTVANRSPITLVTPASSNPSNEHNSTKSMKDVTALHAGSLKSSISDGKIPKKYRVEVLVCFSHQELDGRRDPTLPEEDGDLHLLLMNGCDTLFDVRRELQENLALLGASDSNNPGNFVFLREVAVPARLASLELRRRCHRTISLQSQTDAAAKACELNADVGSGSTWTALEGAALPRRWITISTTQEGNYRVSDFITRAPPSSPLSIVPMTEGMPSSSAALPSPFRTSSVTSVSTPMRDRNFSMLSGQTDYPAFSKNEDRFDRNICGM